MPADVTISVHLQPRASRDQVVGRLDDGTVRIRVAAPPVEGEANERLLRFLARLLVVSRSRVRLIGGDRSRRKRVAVEGLSLEEVERRLGLRGGASRDE